MDIIGLLLVLDNVLPSDPWEHDSEYGDSCFWCHRERRWNAEVYEHNEDCAWLKACVLLGRDVSAHAIHTPAPAAPCEICDIDENATVDSHVAHLARDWAKYEQERLEAKMRGERPFSDIMPIIRAPRGGIVFAKPPMSDLVLVDPAPVVEIESTTEDWQRNAFTFRMYDWGMSGPDYVRPFTPDDEEIAKFARCTRTEGCTRVSWHGGDCAI